MVGYRRIKNERFYFGSRIFDIFSEWKNTWIASIVSGLLISIILIGLGVVFSYETLFLLSLITILLSITLHFTLLSPSYTIGITYLVLLFIPTFWEQQTIFDESLFSHINFTGLAVLLGLFLLVEAIMVLKSRRNELYPSLVQGKRGGWIGQQQIKKLSLIPFIALLPSGAITAIEPYWPVLSVGNGTFGLIIFPFILGYDFKVVTEMPIIVSKRIGKGILLLAIIVIILAVASYYTPWLSLAAVLVAIVGREIMNYRERIIDKKKHPYFHQEREGLRVLSVIPNTPADRLGILVGEKIIKVNGNTINKMDEFYEALQNSGSFFKMEILDDENEIRFVQSAFYEGEHHKLGLIFADIPYRHK